MTATAVTLKRAVRYSASSSAIDSIMNISLDITPRYMPGPDS